MRIYLLRHGIANEAGWNSVSSDENRKLSDEGKDKARIIAKALKAIKCKPALIVSSPLTRAVQTADIVSKALNADVDIDKILKPGSSLEESVKWLSKKTAEDIMLVGHNPHLELLASYLVAGNESVDIRLKKASICKIVFPNAVKPGQGRLEWLIQPAQLIKIVS